MATNDGYSPYAIGLTALQVKDSITRSHNLSTELGHGAAFSGRYVGYSDANTPPNVNQGIKEGDIWHDITNGIFYRAYIDTTVIPNVALYFEI